MAPIKQCPRLREQGDGLLGLGKRMGVQICVESMLSMKTRTSQMQSSPMRHLQHFLFRQTALHDRSRWPHLRQQVEMEITRRWQRGATTLGVVVAVTPRVSRSRCSQCPTRTMQTRNLDRHLGKSCCVTSRRLQLRRRCYRTGSQEDMVAARGRRNAGRSRCSRCPAHRGSFRNLDRHRCKRD